MRLKLLSIAVLCGLSAGRLNAQDIKISSNGVLVKDAKDHTEPITVSGTDEGYILAYGDGFVTRAEKIENLASKNLTTYDLKLKKLVHPVLAKEQRKIQFAKFIDKTNKMGYVITNGITAYGSYVSIYSGNSQNNSKINAKLIKEGFNAIDDDNPENNKDKSFNPDLGIAGEVLYYNASGRGTPGFKTSIVVRWTIYDVSEEKILYKVTTAGYTDNGKQINQEAAFMLAAKDALWGLMVDEEFVKMCNKEDAGNDIVSNGYSFPLIATPTYADNSSMIEGSIKSAVTIKSPSGYGSGFIISESGYVLTNNHVIADSGKFEVLFNNGLKLTAVVVAKNKTRDVALLKIAGEGFTPLSIDTTDASARVGADVIAIGTPENIKLGQTVTKGIISGMRDFDNQKYIQTDVSLNPGNSGGALIDKKGAVVGIVVAKMKGNGLEGLGFAIPVNQALKALNVKFK